MTQECSPADFMTKFANDQSVLLIDVRSPAEYRELHATSAVNVPLDTLSKVSVDALAKRAKLFFICRSGGRSKRACALSATASATSISGGTEAWAASGLPVERGNKELSLERQVRIAAGLLVLIGALLSLFVHSTYALVPAFVGGGLVFAGVTGWCGMALLLAKMPWNRN